MKKRETRSNLLNLSNKEITTSVELLQYNEKMFLKTMHPLHTDLKKHILSDRVSWFKVTGISDAEYVSEICKKFNLHSFDIRDLLAATRVVKVVLYDDVSFVLVPVFFNNANGELENMKLAFILGKNFVISFKETNVSVFKEVEKAIESDNLTVRKKGADFLLYVLLSTVNSMNNDLIMKFEEKLFDVEEELIMQKETINVLHILHSQRIAHIQLKRFIISFREEYANLLDNVNKLVKKENLVYFENLDDKLRTTTANLDNFHESLLSLLDLYYNNNNLKMNEVMKRLTLVSTIFIPLTFLVGVWGMNFTNMPEIAWEYGYLMAWIILFIAVVIMSFLLRKEKWFR